MLAAILGTSLVYLIEHDQVCLIDTVSGERDRLLAEAKARADEYIAIYGTPPVEEYPECQAILGSWILPWLLFAVTIFFVYVVRVWGLPIVAVAIVIALYTVLSAAAWYFDWADHRYLTTSIGTVTDGAKSYAAGVIGARNAITLESNGLLGQFLNITVNIVFPYVVLGALFGASAGGRSLIKLAVVITRNLRGGPGPRGDRGLGHVRHDFGRPGGQRAGHRNAHHPDDDADRLRADLRGRRRGRGVERRSVHAAGDGHRRVRAVGVVDGALFRRDHRGLSARARLFPEPVPGRRLRGPPVEPASRRATDRGAKAHA